jgi:hypothetical protein
VQRVKAQKHLGIGGQVTKKMYLISAYVSTLEYAATVQNGVLKMHPQLLFFAAKVQISTSDSGPKYICGQRSKMAFQGLDKQLQIFCLLCTLFAK